MDGMEIERKYKESGAKWENITLEDCIEHTECSGYWKEGSVISMLKQGQIVFTPFAFYRQKN